MLFVVEKEERKAREAEEEAKKNPEKKVLCHKIFFDPGVASSILVRSHTFVEIEHEMISTVILPLPLIYSRRVVVSYKRKYVHELLVNRLFKPAQEKVLLGELTLPQWP